MVGVLVMVGFGALLAGFGGYCLATGKMFETMGRRTMLVETKLAYPFGALFVVAGLGAFGMAGKLAWAAQTLVGSCNQRGELRQCLELHGGSLQALGADCESGAISVEACPEDSLVGRCAFDGPSRVLFIYADMMERDRVTEEPLCESQGGTWSK